MSEKVFKNKSGVFLIGLTFLLGIAIYSNTFSNSFHLDDFQSIIENNNIKDISNLKYIWIYWPSRFVAYFSISLNYYLHQLNVAGYHIFNLAVHICSAVFVWKFISLTFLSSVIKEKKIAQYGQKIAFFSGLIFLVHPIQTQAVTYIVQRAASLATLFYLLTLVLYVKSRLLQKEGLKRSIQNRYYTVSLVTAIAAMLSKEMALSLPFMILLYDKLFLNSKGDSSLKRIIPFFALMVVPVSLLLIKPLNSVKQELSLDISSGEYLLTQFRVIITYIRLLFLPVHQNLDYDYRITKTFIDYSFLVSFFLLISIVSFAIVKFKKYPLLSFGVFWFFMTIIPESSIISIKDVIFEHRLYLPMAGYSLFIVTSSYHLFLNKKLSRPAILLILLIIFYSVLTYSRNFVWKNEIILWTDTIAKSPRKPRVYNNRGLAYISLADYKKAIIDFNQAINLAPSYAKTYNNRGVAYFHNGEFDLAVFDFSKAIELDAGYSEAYRNLGNLYATKGDFNRALTCYDKAIILEPTSAQAYYNRGNMFLDKADIEKAILDYNNAKELDPNFSDVYINLGFIYSGKKEYDQAILYYTQAIKLDRSFYKGYYNRGNAYLSKSNHDKALSDYKMVIRLNPGHSEAYFNLGLIYYSLRQNQQAKDYFLKAKAVIEKRKESKNIQRVEEYLRLL